MYVCACTSLSVCIYMYVYTQCLCMTLQRSKEDEHSPGTGVTGGCELYCGFLELNSGLLRKAVRALKNLLISAVSKIFYFLFGIFKIPKFFSLENGQDQGF